MKLMGMKIGYQAVGIVCIVVMVLASIVGFYYGPSMIKGKIMEMNLKPGTDRRALWEKTPFPLIFSAYVFNITNPMEYTQGQKPHLKEIGPYVFFEFKSKIVVSDDEEEDTVTFHMINTYIYRPDLMKGLTGEEVVYVPHPLLMGGLIGTQRDKSKAGLFGIIVKAFTQIFEPEETPLLKVKVMDLLFNGVVINCDREETEASIVCPMFGMNKALVPLNDTHYLFSLLGTKNATSLGKFKVYRGVKNIQDIGKVLSVNDKNVTGALGKDCSEITGFEGSIFPPFHTKKESFFTFSPGLCRTLEFKFQKDSSFNGVPTSVHSTDFSSQNEPKPQCYCRDGDPSKCLPKGIWDTFPCSGNPMVVSKPHFLDVDKSIFETVSGLKPDRKLHDIYLHYELYTSSSIAVRSRTQFSMDVERVNGFDLMESLTPGLVPIFWIEDALDMPPEATDKMKNGIYFTLTILNVIKVFGILIGLVGVLFAGYKRYELAILKKLNEMQSGGDVVT